MPTVLEIPTANFPQRYAIALGGVPYTLCFQFRNPGPFFGDKGLWVLDIGDRAGNPMVQGIPLIPGVDLLAQYEYLNFGGQLWVMKDGTPEVPPTFEGLGSESRLLWVTFP